MSEYCVVVSGGACARFFTLEPVDIPEMESGPKLMDRGEISNPEKEAGPRNLFTDSKTGRGRAPGGGPSHGYDDHRLQHEDEFDKRFAHKVLQKCKDLASNNKARCVIMVAPNHILGLIRQELDSLMKLGMTVKKLPKDMTKFSSKQIHDYLAKADMLPPCKKPGV